MGLLLNQAVKQNQSLQQAPLQRTAQRPPMLQPTPVRAQTGMSPGPQVQTPAPEAQQGMSVVPEKQKELKDADNVLDQFVGNAVKVIHTPKVTDSILRAVKSYQDPVDGVGEESVKIAGKVSEGATASRLPLSVEIVAHGMNAIVGEVATLASASGVVDLNDEQKYQAYSFALSKYLSYALKKGDISEESIIQIGKAAAQTPEGTEVAKRLDGGM